MIRKVNAKLRPLAAKLQAATDRRQDIHARLDAARARIEQLEQQEKQALDEQKHAYLDLVEADSNKARSFIFSGHLYRNTGYEVVREVMR